eukprot:SAG31_NODE_2800_length_5077_cov_2.098433_12_plen_82_part_00
MTSLDLPYIFTHQISLPYQRSPSQVSLNGKSGRVNYTEDKTGLPLLTGYTTDVGRNRGKDFQHHFHATVCKRRASANQLSR